MSDQATDNVATLAVSALQLHCIALWWRLETGSKRDIYKTMYGTSVGSSLVMLLFEDGHVNCLNCFDGLYYTETLAEVWLCLRLNEIIISIIK